MIEWLGQKAVTGYSYLASLATLSCQSCVELVVPAKQGRTETFRIIARQIYLRAWMRFRLRV